MPRDAHMMRREIILIVSEPDVTFEDMAIGA